MSVSLREFVLSRCSTYAHAGGRKGWLHVHYSYASLIRFIFCSSEQHKSQFRRHLEHLQQI